MVQPIKRDNDKTSRSQPLSGAPRHGEMREVKIPGVPSEWHPRAKSWYRSLKTSGQADYFQNSDWQQALMAGDLITFIWNGKFLVRGSAMMMSELSTMLGQLGTSEGARRQIMRVELDVPIEQEDSEEQKNASMYAFMLDKKPSE